MEWRNITSVIVVMATVSCGTEATRPSVPSDTPTPSASASVTKTPPPTPVVSAEPQTPTPLQPVVADASTTHTIPSTTPAAPVDPKVKSEEPEVAKSEDPVDPKVKPEEPKVAKSGAPVTMKAAFSKPGVADLDLVFNSDGTDVTIKVWGVDGLNVTKNPISDPIPTVRSGQELKLAVEYTALAGSDHNLAVSVTGKFAGHKQSRVQSFTVSASPPAPQTPTKPPKTDKDGRKIKVMTPK